MKRVFCAVLALWLCLTPALAVTGEPTVEAPAVLLLERETGTVLYEQNAHTTYEPASVTKIMTMLLIMEAIDGGQLGLEDPVSVSTHASSMGGSQIYLKEGERMSVGDLLKSVAVASANDAAVALAEHLAGSEEAFVARMNERARELGMEHTTFLNCTGLPVRGHETTAWDIAQMSRELLSHEGIRQYTTLWMDSVREGQFQLSNTNKLIRFYDGATGLKTGFTDSAKFCLSASARRDGMELIAVVLHAETSDQRFETAKSLLNFGFANYTLLDVYPSEALPPVEVELGEVDTVQPLLAQPARILVEKGDVGKVNSTIELTERVQAPVEPGQTLGTMRVWLDGVEQQSLPLVADREVARLGFGGVLGRLMERFFCAQTH